MATVAGHHSSGRMAGAGAGALPRQVEIGRGGGGPGWLVLDPDRRPPEFDSLHDRGADPAHRIDHQISRLRVGRDRMAGDLREHLRRMLQAGFGVPVKPLRTRRCLPAQPHRTPPEPVRVVHRAPPSSARVNNSTSAWARRCALPGNGGAVSTSVPASVSSTSTVVATMCCTYRNPTAPALEVTSA